MKFPINTDIVLENERVLIESMHKMEHCDVLKKIAIGHPEILTYSPSEFHTEALFHSYMNQALDQSKAGQRCIFRVYDKLKGEYAGSSSFGNISDKNERIEIGWTWIGKSFQKTGLNRNMKLLMMEYAFDQLKAKRVELKADARNEQSRTAMEGIGVTYEGCLREHTVMSDGFRRDTVYYSILAGEWPDIRRKLLLKIR